MLPALRARLFRPHVASLPLSPSHSLKSRSFGLSLRSPFSHSSRQNPNPHAPAAKPAVSDAVEFVRTVLFVPPGVEPEEVTDDMILPGSNIVLGPYVGDAKIKEVEFVKSSSRPKDCPKDQRPEFAMLGRSNVGKSSLINALVRKKEVALTSKKPGLGLLYIAHYVFDIWFLGVGFKCSFIVIKICRKNPTD